MNFNEQGVVTNERVSWGDVLNFEMNNGASFSAMAWIKLPVTPLALGATIGKHSTVGGEPGWTLWINTTPAIRIDMAPADAGHTTVGGTTLSLNTWYQIGLSYNGTTDARAIYLNGVVDGSNTFTPNGPTVTTAAFTMAMRNAGADGTFYGRIAESAVWQTALSAQQFVELYARGKTTNLRKLSSAGSLVFWTRCGDHPGDSTSDLWDLAGNRSGTASNLDAEDIIVDSP